MRSRQHYFLRFDPANGSVCSSPISDEQYRATHWKVAWLFDPWTGKRRDAKDVGIDTFGFLIPNPFVNHQKDEVN